jgi:Domain of unknown function (DUF4249)
MKNISLIIVAIFTITACQSEVSVIDIENENKLVVLSFISPQDTILSVRVSNTNPVIGQVSKEFKAISNATVKIGNGIKSVLLPYDKDGYYRVSSKQLEVKSGQKYLLNVNTPDGRAVSGECIIPLNTIDKTKMIIDIQSLASETKLVSVKWNDIPNEQNYYALTGTYETLRKDCNNDFPFYVRDNNRDGEQLFYNFNTSIVCGSGNPNFILIIANYDFNGYQYILTLQEQFSVNGVPFTEPVQIFTNIKGGYGVFSGYNQLRTMVKMF